MENKFLLHLVYIDYFRAHKSEKMNLDERMEQSGTYSAFRTSLDMAMGAVYIIIGVVVFTMRYFGTVELPTGTSWALGGLLLLYGAFRIYRGLTAIWRKRSSDRSGRR